MADPDELERIIITYCPSCGGDEIAVLNGQYICTTPGCGAKWDLLLGLGKCVPWTEEMSARAKTLTEGVEIDNTKQG
jgi:hypothetical protein